MEAVWPSVLVNGALVIFLWGLLWRSNNQRIDKIESGAKGVVGREYCRLQHQEIREDFREIKDGQREMMASLRKIENRLAERNGEEKARKKGSGL